MPVSSLLWGTNFENQVSIGYPLFDVVTDREERDGSEHIQSPAGVEDSWITGRDYTLDVEARWIPDGPNTSPVQTQLSGPVSWQEFLDWARDTNSFRFVPDATVPDFYVDNVYLVEPRKGFGSLTADIKRKVQLKLRNATKDFHEALRGIMFEYRPGTDLTQPIAYTATRASAGTRRGQPSTLMGAAIGASDLINVLRDRHYEGSLKTTLVEAARNQLVPDPENFGNWTAVGPPVLTAGQADPFGGTAAYLINDNSAVASEYIVETVTFTGDATKALAIFVKAGTAAINTIDLFDATAIVKRIQLTITWTAGVPAPAITGGGGSVTAENWGGGWYRLLITANSVVAANTNQIRMFPAQDAGAGPTGTTYFFGVNAWNQLYPASYQGPSLAARSGDVFYRTFSYIQQPLFIHRKWVSRGTPKTFQARSAIGNAAHGGSRVHIISGDTGQYYFESYNAANVGLATTSTPNDAYGDIWEFLGMLNSDGSVAARYIRNGGGEIALTPSAGRTLDGYWGTGPSDSIFVEPGGAGLVTTYADALIFEKIGPLTFGGVARNTIALAAAA